MQPGRGCRPWPRSKLLVLDAKDAFSKQKLLEAGRARLYPGLLERVGSSDGGKVVSVDAASRTVITEFGAHRADVIPPQRSGAIAAAAGVADRTGWCPVDPARFESRLQPASMFWTRMGQVDLSCAQCHDGPAGRHLAGATIPQGQPNAYPIYRLEWQVMGSLYRRIRNCLTGARAEPFAPGSDDLTDLELFLASRAAGWTVETPGVRP